MNKIRIGSLLYWLSDDFIWIVLEIPTEAKSSYNMYCVNTGLFCSEYSGTNMITAISQHYAEILYE